MRPEHRRPLIAAVAVLVMCAAMIAHGLRTDALGVVRRPMQVIASDVVDPLAPTGAPQVRSRHDAPVLTPAAPSDPGRPSSAGHAADGSAAAGDPDPSPLTRQPPAPDTTGPDATGPTGDGSLAGHDVHDDARDHAGTGSDGLESDPSSVDDDAQDPPGHADQDGPGPDHAPAHNPGSDPAQGPRLPASVQDAVRPTRELLEAIQELVRSAGLAALSDLTSLSPRSEPAPPTR